ncbi:DUF1345 domain-containing protein [Cryptosporangium sp. NPDC048952]|uniref:DUF1345 domain-containing protein n=1 Tax=Cryptosporangium sp. NPDC048952 TaxID=3363961 RepID=UPI00371F460A
MNWLSREWVRQLVALPPALLSVIVPGGPTIKYLTGWNIYATVYLVVTWLVYRRRDPAALLTLARTSRRRPRASRILASHPEQLAQTSATIAMSATVVYLPQADRLGLPTPLSFAICLVAVFTAWMVLHAGFALAYLALYAELGGLEFPGGEQPAMTEFLYFTISVGTTFGTTDVTVTSRRMRRHVLVHGILSFLFNTLILAVALTILTSYLSGA